MPDLLSLLTQVLASHEAWTKEWHTFSPDPCLEIDPVLLREVLTELGDRLRDNYPFFHPCYAGQMLKPPHPAALAGYLAAQLINPNNHALDGGPATAALEKELIPDLARMLGFDAHLGHLTSSGTIANLEALWVSRQLRPGTTVLYSDQSHYTHARMCEVLGVRSLSVPTDARGRMIPEDVERLCRDEPVGTVVATVGTTGLGALDPLPDLLSLRDTFGFRLHADAAYGGFFRLIADDASDGVSSLPYASLGHCDSIVIDPHKHGLQPYGCGCVLFRDPAVGVLYRHDSPYTYFSSADLHLGEISLECSRAGAAAAALWTTLRILPLHPRLGLGRILRRCRRAALDLAEGLEKSRDFRLLLPPELDIVTYFPLPTASTLSALSARSTEMFVRGMHDVDAPLYLSTVRVPASRMAALHPDLDIDAEEAVVLRSVLMKPEHGDFVPTLLDRLHALSASL